jgi:diguanylate cyclase (GGDEF)-like protein
MLAMNFVNPECYIELKASGRLPSPKGVALAIVRLLQRNDFKMDDLLRLVQSDPAIAGNLLKFSNAASFCHNRSIVSLSKAIITLGTLRVRNLVLALSVLNNHRGGDCPQFDYEQFWSRSLAAAISAQALASYARITPEENFTAGLLSCVGELALASIFPERYGEIISASDNSPHKRLATEQAAFGTDHRELTATLLLEWGFPEVLVSAIYHSKAPYEADLLEGSRAFGLTFSLHIALSLAEICVTDDVARWAMLPNLFTKAARLGISTVELNSIAEDIVASWLEWGKLLKIQTREITSFTDLLASSQPREHASTHPSSTGPNNKLALLIGSESPGSYAIAGHLKKNGYTVNYASNSTDGLIMAHEIIPDLVMIEMFASEMAGSTFCQALRDIPRAESVYIILVIDYVDADLLTQMLEMGADDFLLRPITGLVLHAKLRGVYKILQLQNELIKERNGLVNSASEWAGTNRRLIHVAMTDPLTQLPNRRHGLDTFSIEWALSNSNNLPLACLMIDIDHFKRINDLNGHKAGDTVLVKIADLLKTCVRNGDLAFRYGGEEFCIICPGATLETACAIAERIRQNTADNLFQLGDMEISVTVSIGVAMMVSTHTSEEALINEADAALYRAKKSGRNRVMSGALSGT